VHPHRAVLHLDEDEHRRLALLDPFQQLRRVGVLLRQLRKLVRELEQELQPLLLPEREELFADLREG
jgi:hypothetical protein